MYEWLKTLLVGTKTTVVVVNACCCPKPTLKKPKAPTLGTGDTLMAIRYPYTMPADTAPDVVTREFSYQVNGGDVTSIQHDAADASGSFIVPVGSAVDYWATMKDGSGNSSAPSVTGHIDSAADTTPPAQPGAPMLGAGETVPD